MNGKKTILVLVSLVVVFFFFGCSELWHPEEYEYMDYKCRNVDGGVEITGYIGSATSIRIPERINNRRVVFIGERAFDYYNNRLV
jgi:hypothetical protein